MRFGVGPLVFIGGLFFYLYNSIYFLREITENVTKSSKETDHTFSKVF